MRYLSCFMAVGVSLVLSAPLADAKEQMQDWNLISPQGVVEKAELKPAPRLSSLEGKTIALRWNGKHNGDVLLEYLGDRLQKDYPTAKIIRTYKSDTSLNGVSGTDKESQRRAKVISALKPDLVIGSQCD